MSRLAEAARLEVVLQYRQKFLHAGVFSGLIWLAVLIPMPPDLRATAEPYVLLGDIAIIGFYFIGASVFFEKQERTLSALLITPLRFQEYLAAKISILCALSVTVAVTVVTVAHGLHYRLLPLLGGILLGTIIMLLTGFVTSLPFASVSSWFLSSTIPLALMNLPILHYSGLWPSPVLYAVPTLGPLTLLGAAFDQVHLTPWHIVYTVGYPALCAVVLAVAAQRMFTRFVTRRAGT